jgi:hypothetical protein
LTSFVPFWLTTEFPKPGQEKIGRNTAICMGKRPDGTWTNNAERYCRDSLWFFWGEPVNVVCDRRMTGTGYLGENTLLMAELGTGAFLFFILFNFLRPYESTWEYLWDQRAKNSTNSVE